MGDPNHSAARVCGQRTLGKGRSRIIAAIIDNDQLGDKGLAS
jgi:hypothetical protein